MCRKQPDQVFTYKPLGVLKRSTVVRPTYGERERDAHVTMTTQHTCLHISVSTQNRRDVVKLLRSACLEEV